MRATPSSTPYSSVSQDSLRQLGLLRFELSSLQGWTAITQALLTVDVINPNYNAELGAFGTAWDANATWQQASLGVPWGTSACPMGPRGCGVSVFAAGQFASKGLVTMDVTATVKGWLADPDRNFGFYIGLTGTSDGDLVTIASSENSSAGLRPQLSIMR
jgi:hypothetical protein